MNAGRTALVKKEIAQIEKQIAADAKKRENDAAAPQREAAARVRAEELRVLAKNLVTNPEASADLMLTQYDGRFKTPEEVTAGITAAYNEFANTHNLSHVQLARLKAILGFQPLCDLSKVEVWVAAYEYMQGLLEPKEPQESVADATGDSTDLTEIDPLKGLSGRAREKRERELYQQEVLTETMKNPTYDRTVQELVDATRLQMSSSVNVGFRVWLDAAPQRRRYTNTREDIRFAAAEYFGSSVYDVLTEGEQLEIARRKAVEALSSEEIKRSVGFNNSYDPSNQTFRASRAEQNPTEQQ